MTKVTIATHLQGCPAKSFDNEVFELELCLTGLGKLVLQVSFHRMQCGNYSDKVYLRVRN